MMVVDILVGFFYVKREWSEKICCGGRCALIRNLFAALECMRVLVSYLAGVGQGGVRSYGN